MHKDNCMLFREWLGWIFCSTHILLINTVRYHYLIITHIYVLCIMCKSSLTHLQMINNSLTVKFQYLFCFEPLHLYRYRHFQVLSVPLFHSHRDCHLSWVLCDLKRQIVLTCQVRSISAVTCTGISNPLCTMGDLLWFLSDNLSTNNLSSEVEKARCSGNFFGQVTDCRVGIFITQLQRTLHMSIMSLTLLMLHDAVCMVWFCYQLMIFSNRKCTIIIKFSK